MPFFVKFYKNKMKQGSPIWYKLHPKTTVTIMTLIPIPDVVECIRQNKIFTFFKTRDRFGRSAF